MDRIGGAIVATPPVSHFAICSRVLQHGRHVLCEKPLAPTADEAARLVALAEQSSAVLCVNQTRRMYPTNQRVKELIADGSLGRLQAIEYIDGSVFNWPTASGFYFEAGAPGVLSDRGVHSLDLVSWWLGAKPRLVRVQTDSYGGPESVALLAMTHEDCRIDLKISWLTRLQNTFRVVGTEATVEGDIGGWRSMRMTTSDGGRSTIRLPDAPVEYNDFAVPMIENFLAVLDQAEEPSVSAASVIAAAELIDEAYAAATRLHMPWLYGAVAL